MEIINPRKKIFIAYSRQDVELLNRLKIHLKALERSNLIEVWSDSDIEAGQNWDTEIKNSLINSDIILLLISADFIASDYCYENEMRLALKQHENKKSRVIPIILRECLWQLTPFAKFQALPNEGLAITHSDWGSIDQPLNSIVQELVRIIKNIDEEQKDQDKLRKENLNTSGSRLDDRSNKSKKEKNLNSNFINKDDIRIHVPLTLEQIQTGIIKKVKYKRREKCKSCNGEGGVESKDRCITCSGNGFTLIDHVVEIDFPAGLESSMQLSLKDQGHEVIINDNANIWRNIPVKEGKDFGNLYVSIEEVQHEKFLRDGVDLILNHHISAFEAILGTDAKLEMLDKSLILIKIPAGTQDGKILRIPGKGLPNIRDPKIGNLLVIVKVDIPKNLSEEDEKFINKLRDSI